MDESSPGSTLALVIDCQNALQRCCDEEILCRKSWAQSRLAGFNLWAAGLAIFATGRRAIHERLRDSPQVLQSLTVVLRLLSTAAIDCVRIASTITSQTNLNDELQQQLNTSRRDIETLIRNLVTLGSAIRQAGRRSHLAKADASFHVSKYDALYRHVKVVLQHRIYHDARLQSSDEGSQDSVEPEFSQSAVLEAPSTRDRVREIIKTELGPDQKHLIESVLRRRHRFDWARHRYPGEIKLHPSTQNIDAQSKQDILPAEGATTENAGLVDRRDLADAIAKPSAQALRLPTPSVHGTVSTIDAEHLKNRTAVPSIQLTATTLTLDYPLPPKAVRAIDIEQFVCPCCFETLPVEVGRSKSKWKAHIARDLQPYTCPHRDCRNSTVFFATKKALTSHVETSHRVITHWRCRLCKAATIFDSEAALERHLQSSVHANAIFGDSVAATVRSFAVKAVDLDIICPICNGTANRYDRADEKETFFDHLCRHVHDFALLALPWNDKSDHSYSTEASDHILRIQQWLPAIVTYRQGEDLRSNEPDPYTSSSNDALMFLDIFDQDERRALQLDDAMQSDNEPEHVRTEKYFDDSDDEESLSIDSGLAENLLDIIDEFKEDHDHLDELDIHIDQLRGIVGQHTTSNADSHWLSAVCELGSAESPLRNLVNPHLSYHERRVWQSNICVMLRTGIQENVMCDENILRIARWKCDMQPETEPKSSLGTFRTSDEEGPSEHGNAPSDAETSENASNIASADHVQSDATGGQVRKAQDGSNDEDDTSDLSSPSHDDLASELVDASSNGLASKVEALLERGADVNARTVHVSALEGASENGHLDTAQLLLERGADVNAQGGFYGNALQAASYKDGKIVELLLAHGAGVNAQGGFYGNALQAASCSDGKIVELLLAHGADINASGGHYGNALQAASAYGLTEIAKLLLDHGADVNAQGGYNGNALRAASRIGSMETVKLLLEHDADIDAQGGQYGNALQAAACEGDLETAKLLLEHGANVHASGGRFASALIAASIGGHEDIVRLLIDHGVDVNAQGNGTYPSACIAASREGQGEVLKLLLANGGILNPEGQEKEEDQALRAAGEA